MTGFLRRFNIRVLGIVSGAYFSWIVRTMVTGDIPSITGSLIVIFGSMLGWLFGSHLFGEMSNIKILIVLLSHLSRGISMALLGSSNLHPL
ncbi:MAG: hypothetical protein A2Z14_07685 [Chloroflexi bacterium RBG_16_48_8]|nr:MAG: hypothetical protein A2Z14_07685 [Chloroflexi bacterium RBG_16_48_8]